ncbi:MAG: DUF488 domain-containing protein [Candidatus Brockarchaeota archaeon]|nr:DUF488 domain-containing protein [Candidatus Brockarchaeota archaeon]
MAERKGRLIIWTIGYGSLSKEEFLRLLRRQRIRILVDIRRFPKSKSEHFTMENIEKWLLENGIVYFWLGEELGGYRREGYEKYMETTRFKEGVNKLLEIAGKDRTCIMCLETDPKYCHRRFIAHYLTRRGIRVIHIVQSKNVKN